MRRFLVILIALLLIGVQTSVVLAQEATPAPGGGAEALAEQVQGGEICAWPVAVAVDALNIGAPDTNAIYYVTPYSLTPGQSLILDGAYPFARFSSLTTYYGIGIPDQALELIGWLRDSEIAPNPGSVNPAVDANAPDDPAQRQWTVRVTGTVAVDGASLAATPTGEVNVIPAHREGAVGELGLMGLRVYVPQDPADPTGGVRLPVITIEDADGTTRELGACTAEEEQAWTRAIGQLLSSAFASAEQFPLPSSADAQPEWEQTSLPGVGPNPDNRYLMAPVAWEPGRIVVIRGQAPTFPDTRAGESPTTSTDLRYWSFCTVSQGIDEELYPTTACVGDFAIPLDPDGVYTVVVSQPADQPANATAENGVAWLEGTDAALSDLLLVRHMLPSDAFFDQSVWAVPELPPGAAEEIMGPYYPQVTYCDTATFEEGGADACFAAAEDATPTG
jgi:hypothetical protein